MGSKADLIVFATAIAASEKSSRLLFFFGGISPRIHQEPGKMGESVDFLKPMEQSSKSQETNLDPARFQEMGQADVRFANTWLTRPTEAQVANCFGFDQCRC